MDSDKTDNDPRLIGRWKLVDVLSTRQTARQENFWFGSIHEFDGALFVRKKDKTTDRYTTIANSQIIFSTVPGNFIVKGYYRIADDKLYLRCGCVHKGFPPAFEDASVSLTQTEVFVRQDAGMKGIPRETGSPAVLPMPDNSLVGTWKLIDVVLDGQHAKAPHMGETLQVTSKQLIFSKRKWKMAYKTGLCGAARTIDIKTATATLLGLYDTDGEVLRILWTIANQARPASFPAPSGPGGQIRIETYHRSSPSAVTQCPAPRIGRLPSRAAVTLAVNWDTETFRIIQPRQYSPCREAQVDTTEHEIGARLPDPYYQFLLTYNGGRPKDPYFCFKADGEAQESFVQWFFALHDGKVIPPRSRHPQDDPRDPRSLDQVWREFHEETDEKNLLPIGCDPCGNYICIVIKGKTAGQIRFFDHECGYATGKLAPDFLTFLRSLKPMPPGDWPAWATHPEE